MNIREAFEHELANLKTNFVHELNSITNRVNDAKMRQSYSTHTPFNISADAQNLAVIAAKIESTEMVLRTLDAPTAGVTR